MDLIIFEWMFWQHCWSLSEIKNTFNFKNKCSSLVELKLKPLDPTYVSNLNINIKFKSYLLNFIFSYSKFNGVFKTKPQCAWNQRKNKKWALQNLENGGQLVFASSERDFSLLCPQHSPRKEKSGKLIWINTYIGIFMNEVKRRAVPRSKN